MHSSWFEIEYLQPTTKAKGGGWINQSDRMRRVIWNQQLAVYPAPLLFLALLVFHTHDVIRGYRVLLVQLQAEGPSRPGFRQKGEPSEFRQKLSQTDTTSPSAIHGGNPESQRSRLISNAWQWVIHREPSCYLAGQETKIQCLLFSACCCCWGGFLTWMARRRIDYIMRETRRPRPQSRWNDDSWIPNLYPSRSRKDESVLG